MTRDKSGGSDGQLTCSTILFRSSFLYCQFLVWESLIFIPSSNAKCTGTNIYIYSNIWALVSLLFEMHVDCRVGWMDYNYCTDCHGLVPMGRVHTGRRITIHATLGFVFYTFLVVLSFNGDVCPYFPRS